MTKTPKTMFSAYSHLCESKWGLLGLGCLESNFEIKIDEPHLVRFGSFVGFLFS